MGIVIHRVRHLQAASAMHERIFTICAIILANLSNILSNRSRMRPL